jgi:alpha-glucosidase
LPEEMSTWWKDAVVYQVYPRSFADSDGDGIGDLEGLRGRLDYLSDLGVDAIWLTPFYPSPLHDGGYDVANYCDVDPRLGTLGGFDALVADARARGIRVLVDLVPNHCSSDHPLFRAALAGGPGSPEREWFIFRPGRGPDGSEPPNNWPSAFGGPAWDRLPDGDWYLHMFDASQPDFNWRNPAVVAMFEDVLRFWLDRGVAGFRVDVAHALFKDPMLADTPTAVRSYAPSGYYHQPELHGLYRSWRKILDSYPTSTFPGSRTAIGEVWYDTQATLRPYLAPDELPQVFNFDLILAPWEAGPIRAAIDTTDEMSDGSQAPWVLGNHDVIRPVTRFGGPRNARVAALLLFALPGSAYIYQGEELGLPEVLDIPDAARQDPTFRRTGGKRVGRDGCRVPLPWSAHGDSFGFSGTTSGQSAPPWLPQPAGWGAYSVEEERTDPGSFLSLYRAALRLRKSHPALGAAGPLLWGSDCTPAGTAADTGESSAEQILHFRREPGFEFFANMGTSPVPLPPHREVLLASEPSILNDPASVPPGTAVWLAVLCNLPVVAHVRVPRKGVTQAELAGVLSRRLSLGYQVEPGSKGRVRVSRSPLSTAVVRIHNVPGATVFRVRGGGVPVLGMGTTRAVTNALRSSPEFRSV